VDSHRWRTVAINLDQPRLVIDPTWIEGAKTATLRVIGSDGIHSAEVTSDNLNLDVPIVAPSPAGN
jgi:hypothetical protein